MIKMYIEYNNGNNGILLTDGSQWIYLDAAEIAADISEEETAAENVRNAIENGDLYGAEDLWDECFDDEHHISEYDGLTLDEIDTAVNYENGMPKNHDVTTWEEI